jgi:TolB-like protein/Flp pilus assembly protein TadD
MGDLLARLQSALGDAYRIEKELGGGGMSRLFLATEASLHRQVVIKLLPPEFASAVSTARFKQEIELAAHLQHPNILPVLSAGAKDDLLFYVMPFVSGESLRHRLTREGKLPVADAVRILYEIADALAYAHAEGVIHRDIKPENILLLGAHAGLTDFGVARALAESRSGGRLTDTGLALGTPGYMSPEQAAGDRHIDARADVYALAVVGYEMLAGRPPFAGPTAQAVIAAHLTVTPKPLTDARPETPTAVANAITQALAKDPNARLRTAAELRDAIAGGLPSSLKRRQRLAGGLIAASVAALILGLALWTRSRETAVSTPGGPTLAVLPFQNLGAAGDRYFADGITEEITTRLTAISGIRVIGRASANAYQNTAKPLDQVGRELGAQYMLEGTIRTDRARGNAGQARVAPELIRAADGTNLWAAAYTVDLTPGAIFDAQTQIAEKVAQGLNVTLLGSERAALASRPTANAEAYDAYLRGNEYLRRGLGQNWPAQRIAERMYERATQLDPRFAQAYAGLAATELQMYQSTYDMSMTPHLTFPERLTRVKQAADEALRLEPGLPDLHRTLAGYYEALGDSAQAERQFELWGRAAPSDPQAIAEQAARQAAQGKWQDAQASLERALQLDPRSASLLARAGAIYTRAGRYRQGEPYYDRWVALTPDDPQPYGLKAWLHLLQGDTARARRVLKGGATSAGLPNLLAAIVRSSFLINMLRILPDYGTVVRGLSLDSFDNDTADYVIAKTMAYWSQPERARAYWDSTRIWALGWIRSQPELSFKNSPAYLSLAAAAAAFRERQKARDIIRDLDRGVRWGSQYGGNQGLIAEVYVMNGDPEAAIDRLAIALHEPRFYSPALLRLDPIWDPLRGNPRFQALLQAR